MTKGELQALRRRLNGTHEGRYDQRTWRRIKEYKRKPSAPGASKAWNAVRRGLLKGTLSRGPCEVCGSEKVHAHHHRGYDHPLEIQWLCKSCHQRMESGNTEALAIIGAMYETRQRGK